MASEWWTAKIATLPALRAELARERPTGSRRVGELYYQIKSIEALERQVAERGRTDAFRSAIANTKDKGTAAVKAALDADLAAQSNPFTAARIAERNGPIAAAVDARIAELAAKPAADADRAARVAGARAEYERLSAANPIAAAAFAEKNSAIFDAPTTEAAK